MKFLVPLFFVASLASAQQLTPGERSLAHAVDTHNAEALALLERVVDINSGTMNFAGVRAVGDVFTRELQSLGFTTRWAGEDAVNRAGHLVAEHRGSGPKILLIGHLDTVFEPSSPFQRFQRLSDSTATGPGVIDMKGGDVIIVYALRALRDAGMLDRMNVTVVMDGDEEEAGRPIALARKALVDAAQGAAYAIGFEDGPGDPHYGVIARRGATNWKVTTTGYPGHASQIFHEDIGAGAIFEAARILDTFRERLSSEQYLAFSPGLALGGSAVTLDSTWTSGSATGKTNVVAQAMTITGDMRTISPEQLAKTEATMREIVAANLPRTTARIDFDEGYPPLAPTDGNRKLLSMYDEASRALGFFPVQPVDPTRAGAADVAFVAGIVPMIIDGVGLSGHDDHSDKETADLRMLSVQTKRAAVLLARLAAVRP
jgi:glutamate carboxypeptidase